jgi:hypothetical protein
VRELEAVVTPVGASPTEIQTITPRRSLSSTRAPPDVGISWVGSARAVLEFPGSEVSVSFDVTRTRRAGSVIS